MARLPPFAEDTSPSPPSIHGGCCSIVTVRVLRLATRENAKVARSRPIRPVYEFDDRITPVAQAGYLNNHAVVQFSPRFPGWRRVPLSFDFNHLFHPARLRRRW